VAAKRRGADGLSVEERVFALAYLANGFNGTKAYLTMKPDVKSNTAATEAWKLLRKPEIAAFIAASQDKAWKGLQMSGDEALARVALDARADVRELFDDNGRRLPVHKFPDSIANSIESIEVKRGSFKVKLASKSAARRVILEQTGKLKNPLEDGITALAEALRADLSRSRST
jgi:phage terminase small subunit